MIESYPTEFQAGTCNRATYSLGENGVVNVFNTEVVNQELQTIEGTAVLTDESGKLLVKFPDSKFMLRKIIRLDLAWALPCLQIVLIFHDVYNALREQTVQR